MVNKTAAFLLLGALASEVLASPHYSFGTSLQSQKSNNSLFKRSDADWVCSGDDTPSLMLTHFSAVFFGDFITSGGQDILGPLAVGGKFAANHYMVNANSEPKCSNADDIKDYALVVGGKVDANEVRLKGNAQVPSGSSGLVETINTCKVYEGGKSVYDFNLAHQNAVSASETLAKMRPNMVLRSDGTLSSLREATNGFHVLTFSTCNNGNCNLVPGEMSSPSALLQGQGNWNGPQGMNWPKSGTLLLNIPIESGSTFTLLGNLVTQGMDPCRTIFNFYSSNNGQISSSSFTLKRQTGSNLGAFVLAPRANIIDGSTGAFAGTVVGNNYSWGGSGIEIHNYIAAGGSCKTFEGCIPIVPPKKIITTTTTTTTATTTTTTNAAATTTDCNKTVCKTTTTTAAVPTTTTTDCNKTVCKTTTTTTNAAATTTDCGKTACKGTTTTPAVPTTTTTDCGKGTTTTATDCGKTACKGTTTTPAVPTTTATDCGKTACKGTTTKPATTCNKSTCKNVTTTSIPSTTTTQLRPTTTTSCKHHSTTSCKQHSTTSCKHHTTTKNKSHTTTTACDCERHKSSTRHSTKTTSSDHVTKTTTINKHKSTTIKHKKPTTTCSTSCPKGCGTKTITKVIYVTAK
ncbi:hypothetical protein BD560DRAFT_449621 [Blakeslea trispora]|nr:hypothetical protein BD560DRAFT_449621 [Blakeslea trispora]